MAISIWADEVAGPFCRQSPATWAGLVWTEIVRPTLAADCSVPEQPRRDIGSCFLYEFRFLVGFFSFLLPMLVHDCMKKVTSQPSPTSGILHIHKRCCTDSPTVTLESDLFNLPHSTTQAPNLRFIQSQTLTII